MTNFVPNVVILLLATGLHRWYVVVAYMPPNDAPTIYRVEQALEAAQKGVDAILIGVPNVRLQ